MNDSKLTKDGKIRATYTMKVSWSDGGEFTYRSDDALLKVIKKWGYKYINELDALVIIFQKRKERIDFCQIFDNRKPKGDALEILLEYSKILNRILTNNLPKNYKV